jgi:hypothetical protein
MTQQETQRPSAKPQKKKKKKPGVQLQNRDAEAERAPPHLIYIYIYIYIKTALRPFFAVINNSPFVARYCQCSGPLVVISGSCAMSSGSFFYLDA